MPSRRSVVSEVSFFVDLALFNFQGMNTHRRIHVAESMEQFLDQYAQSDWRTKYAIVGEGILGSS